MGQFFLKLFLLTPAELTANLKSEIYPILQPREERIVKIAIGGCVCTGKDTISELLAEAMGGCPHVSAGSIMRQCATEAGISDIAEFARTVGATACDHEVDERMRIAGIENATIVAQGRLAWRSVPDSYKVLLEADMEVRIKRFKKRESKPDRHITSFQAFEQIGSRDQADLLRYYKTYGIKCFTDECHYNEVIDTSDRTPEEIADQIMRFARRHYELHSGSLMTA